MQTSGEKRSQPIGVGVTTMVVVFFLCTLTVIAVFGMRSVYDRNIGVMKEVLNSEVYYKANGEANEKLEYIYNIISKYNDIGLVTNHLSKADNIIPNILVEQGESDNVTVDYKVNIDANQYISVKLRINDKSMRDKQNKERQVEIMEWGITNE